MKISQINSSKNISTKANIRFNKEALEQISKESLLELQNISKKIGKSRDIILIASKCYNAIPDSKIHNAYYKQYSNAVSYKVGSEFCLAFFKNTRERVRNGVTSKLSDLSSQIEQFLKKM